MSCKPQVRCVPGSCQHSLVQPCHTMISSVCNAHGGLLWWQVLRLGDRLLDVGFKVVCVIFV